MNRSLARVLVRVILPVATWWVARQQKRILSSGDPLNAQALQDAVALGISRPELVRVLAVQPVPMPGGALASMYGLLSGEWWGRTLGLTAGYGIYVVPRLATDRRLLAHELVHVRQYEQLGGIRGFLQRYLEECLAESYASAPMEHEASDDAEKLFR